ncbi:MULTISPECIES: (2Fe-2S)-binding protein [Stigmatella]|uniref:(2Fe-2S)-binding protein n=1 Tax=Stigmatella TaxID=40 RepID=UPI0009425C1A
MIVCLCHVVSDRLIRAHISQGIRTVEGLGEACGAGTSCGGCQDQLEQILVEAKCQAVGTKSACRESCAARTPQLASAAP